MTYAPTHLIADNTVSTGTMPSGRPPFTVGTFKADDEAILQHRLKFLQLDDASKEVLRQHGGSVIKHLDTLLTDFYAHVGQWPELVAKFGGASSIEYAKKMQARHWQGLFSGQFDSN